ncbi:MAG: DUF456 family protein [Burkholderiales bacterium]|nr:DUF456 family protein [Burkholderiales bacterium]
MWWDATLWTIAIAMILIGLVGTVVPIIPGLIFMFLGSWLAASIDNYQQISVFMVVVIGILAALGAVVDWVAQSMGAKRAGASKLGIIGSVVGTILGIFSGLWGLIFMPLLGAAIGEFLSNQDMVKSGKVGFATWLGMIIGITIKLGLAFTIIGLLVADYLI